MLQSDDPLAIPLWIDGHAYLTLAPAFHDVVHARTGAVVRRTPLCGAREAQQAAAAARAALADWAARAHAERAALLAALGDALAEYAAHFAGLLAEESGIDEARACAEVSEAVSVLRAGAPAADTTLVGVVAVVGAADAPLLAPLRLAVAALRAGAVVVVTPHPQTPSALFALAELSARCAFPNGVLSIVHGRDDVLDGLRAAGVRVLASSPGAL